MKITAAVARACRWLVLQSKPNPEKASDLNLELGYDYFRKGRLSEAKEKKAKADAGDAK